jgi:hypothetical protein
MDNQQFHPYKSSIKIILILVLVLFMLAACMITPEQTSFEALFSPTPTLTPTATIVWFPVTSTPDTKIVFTSTPDVSELPGFTDLIFDDGGVVTEHWMSGSEANGTITVGQNSITLAVDGPKGALTTFRKDTLLYNFYFESVMTTSLCKNDDQMGVLFRVNGSMSYYRFSISCSGKISLQQVVGGAPTTLMDWVFTNQLQQGLNKSVKIGVWVNGKELKIYLNDQLQMEVTNNTFYSGGIGFFAKASGDSPVSVNFSGIKVYQVKK